MFQFSADPNPLFQLFSHNTSHMVPHEVPFHSKLTPPRPKAHHSGKKLNFEDPDDVYVSEFTFNINNEETQPNNGSSNGKVLMEIEEEAPTPYNGLGLSKNSSMQTPQKQSKGNFPFLQVTVPAKHDTKQQWLQDSQETPQKSNQNIIGLWRNDHHQVFKGKFSSGATPKLSKDFKVPDSPINPKTKRIKKSLFSSNLPPKPLLVLRKDDHESYKENICDAVNMNMMNMNIELDYSREHTPSPKAKTNSKEHYNTMSIKKERKIFNKNMDLDEDDEYCTQDMRFLTNMKPNKSDPCEPIASSRFVSDYEIIEVIGSGCFGTVYKCLNKFDNMEYAIKCTKNRIKGTKTRHLSLHEAQALASFSSCDENTYIVRYYNAWIEDERLYLVMEHCKYSLKFLKQNPEHHFSESQMRHILRDMAEGLKSLHQRNVVHLDIKPENILYSKTDKYKISDLGLSRIAKRSKGEEISEGDSRYLAPELLMDITDGNLPDLTKADIFSLGVTIYELMTKENIPSNGEEWHRIRRLELPKLFQLTNYSDTLKRLIVAMLNPIPDKRPSAEELLVSDFLRSEIEMELKWEKTQNLMYQEKIREYERILKVKRKKSF